MKSTLPEIKQLRNDIEQRLSRKMRTPYDFEFLSGAIWEKLHENISPTTLKRLWGYIDGTDQTRYSTLNLLVRFIDFQDWDTYAAHLAQNSEIESQIFAGEGIRSCDLTVGNTIEVSWLPNRCCQFRYLGENNFVVIHAENAKIHVGDTFTCAFFIKDQPLYIDNLMQKGQKPVSYVAGSKSGLVHIKLVTQ